MDTHRYKAVRVCVDTVTSTRKKDGVVCVIEIASGSEPRVSIHSICKNCLKYQTCDLRFKPRMWDLSNFYDLTLHSIMAVDYWLDTTCS